MTEAMPMPERTVSRCASCRYSERSFCCHTMARRAQANLGEGECPFWRSISSQSSGPCAVSARGQPLYG